MSRCIDAGEKHLLVDFGNPNHGRVFLQPPERWFGGRGVSPVLILTHKLFFFQLIVSPALLSE